MPKRQCCWQSEGDEITLKIGETEDEVELMYNADGKSEGKGEMEGGGGEGSRVETRTGERGEHEGLKHRFNA